MRADIHLWNRSAERDEERRRIVQDSEARIAPIDERARELQALRDAARYATAERDEIARELTEARAKLDEARAASLGRTLHALRLCGADADGAGAPLSSFHARIRGAIADAGASEAIEHAGVHAIGASRSIVDAFQALLSIEYRQIETSAATVDRVNGFMLRLANETGQAAVDAVARDAFLCGILGCSEGWTR